MRGRVIDLYAKKMSLQDWLSLLLNEKRLDEFLELSVKERADIVDKVLRSDEAYSNLHKAEFDSIYKTKFFQVMRGQN